MTELKIKKINGLQVLDSRGNPTIEVNVHCNKTNASAIAPSGASCGTYEAWELRDNNTKNYFGKGVSKAIRKLKTIENRMKNQTFTQKKFDMTLSKLAGPNKKRLGSNTTTATSLAFLKNLAMKNNKWVYEYLGGKVLPVPFMNIINGGQHAGNKLAIQEFMVVPYGAKTFSQAIQMGSEIYHDLGKQLKEQYGASARNVGDEGGYAPPMDKAEYAFEAIEKSIEEMGYRKQVGIAIDVAASEFYEEMYNIDGTTLTSSELIDYYEHMIANYHLISIEDPFEQNDYEMFAELKDTARGVQIVADDLTVTNLERVKNAVDKDAMTTLLLKVNQIGTVYEAYQAFEYCLSKGIGTMVSHRSGETEDTTIADIAVGLETGQIKSGAPARGERTAKYNQLLRIEQRLGKKAIYAGKDFKKMGKKCKVLEK